MSGDTPKERRGGSRLRRALIVAACALVVAAAVIYYWLFSWSSGYFAADRGRTAEGWPWIGAAEPEITVHEYVDYECPHCPEAHQWLRRELVLHQGSVRLVRHDYARMQCTAARPGRKLRSCELVRAGICAADQGAFWRWNDAVMSNPRPLTGPEREAYSVETARALGLDVAAFEACLSEPGTIERAKAIWSEARRKRVSDTPTYIVDGKRMDAVELAELLGERL